MKEGKLTQNGVHLQEHEYSTIKALLEHGLDVELIPPSQIKGYYNPDIIINGISWEIKAPEGNGRNTMKHNIQHALIQSHNIILDMRRCKLDPTTAIKSAEREFYHSKRTRRMKIILFDPHINTTSKSRSTEKKYIILDYTKK
ncbi:MAG: hypothetical protein J5728_08335 [Lachnospiraceae bacterium]|nr:hypothetical protein [Lachnospiraceae bacterium]